MPSCHPYPPFTDDELDVIDAYVELAAANSTAPLALEIALIRRLMTTARRGLVRTPATTNEKSWTAEEARDAALAAARAAIPQGPTFTGEGNPSPRHVRMTQEPAHFPERETFGIVPSCICGDRWPHPLP